MKLLNSIRVFHALLKQYYNNSKMLLPLLLIIKTLAKNCKQFFYVSDNLFVFKDDETIIFLIAFSLQTLVKDGITGTLEKTFVSVGYTPHLKLRTLLECFKHLTINSKHVCLLKTYSNFFLFFFLLIISTFMIFFIFIELCCNKFVKAGMVHLLMRIFERWERFDGQMRLKICNYALNTLQHLCIISRFTRTNSVKIL